MASPFVDPVPYVEFHIKVAKKVKISPSDLFELLDKDIRDNVSKEPEYGGLRASFSGAQKKSQKGPLLNAYLFSRWAHLQDNEPATKDDLFRAFEGTRYLATIKSLWNEDLNGDHVKTKCGQRPRLQISRAGGLFAFCEEHDLTVKGKRSRRPWCFYEAINEIYPEYMLSSDGNSEGSPPKRPRLSDDSASECNSEGSPPKRPRLSEDSSDLSESRQIFDEAMKVGCVKVNVNNTLLFGMPGTGKTSIKHIMLNIPPPDIRNSTPLADAPKCVIIRNISGVKVKCGKNGWKALTLEAREEMFAEIISQIRSQSDIPNELADKLEQYQLSTESSTLKSGAKTLNSQNSSEEMPGKCVATVVNNMVQLVSEKSVDSKVSQRDPREILGSHWIYIIDSGGQLHFYNLLPLFIQGVTTAVYVLRLSEGLDEHPRVEYYKDGKEVGTSYTSPRSSVENFKYLVRSLQSRSAEREQPNLICVGTFLDKMSDCQESLVEKEQRLSDLVDSDTHDKMIFSDRHMTKSIFTFNAKCPDIHEKCMAEKLRQAIEESAHHHQFDVPVGWFVFEILLETLTDRLSRKFSQKLNA